VSSKYLLLGAGLTSGSSNTGTIVSFAPVFKSSVPAADATEQSASVDIVLTFSQSMAKGTGSVILSNVNGQGQAGTDVTIALSDSQVSISGATVTINPTASLLGSRTYTVTVPAGALTNAATTAVATTAATSFSFATLLDDTVNSSSYGSSSYNYGSSSYGASSYGSSGYGSSSYNYGSSSYPSSYGSSSYNYGSSSYGSSSYGSNSYGSSSYDCSYNEMMKRCKQGEGDPNCNFFFTTLLHLDTPICTQCEATLHPRLTPYTLEHSAPKPNTLPTMVFTPWGQN